MLHIYNDDCSKYDTTSTMGEGSAFQWQIWLCTILVWVICFFCVFQGIKIGGMVVWVTVPLPVVLVFIMVMNGFTLKNSDYGFRMYLKGYENDEPVDVQEKLSTGAMWSEACGQIFFSIGVCLGTMVSYASYLPKNAPVIGNSFAVSLGNCSFSFFAGFTVFSTVGYLVGMNSPVATEVSSIGLAFIAYPAAIDTMPGSNFWALMLSITLFTLGIDSAFAMTEGTITVIQDSYIGTKLSKVVISMIVCGIGMITSTFFCFNWGFTFFDAVDHYLNVYLILLMGIFQAIAIGWVFCFDDAMKKSKPATLLLLIQYYVLMVPLGIISYFVLDDQSILGIPIFWGITFLTWIISAVIACKVSGLSLLDWYENVFFSGVMPICKHMLALTSSPTHRFVERFFEFWWCLCIKYIFPWAIYWLLIMTVRADTKENYGKYHAGWQWIGAIIPVGGLILFLVPLIFNKTKPTNELKECFSAANLPQRHKIMETELSHVPSSNTAVAPEPAGLTNDEPKE